MRLDLAKALAAAPEDDRVWLALADVAIRSGRLDEANDWLDRCEQARPDDEADLASAAAMGRRLRTGQKTSARAAGHFAGSSLPGLACSNSGRGWPHAWAT